MVNGQVKQMKARTAVVPNMYGIMYIHVQLQLYLRVCSVCIYAFTHVTWRWERPEGEQWKLSDAIVKQTSLGQGRTTRNNGDQHHASNRHRCVAS